MKRIILTKSKIFLILCLAVIGGIFWAWLFEARWDRGEIASFLWQIWVIVLLIISIILISVFWRSKGIKVTGFFILFFVLGFWRWEIAQPKITEEHIAYYNDQEAITFVGVISREPDVRDENVKLTVSCRGDQKGKHTGSSLPVWLLESRESVQGRSHRIAPTTGKALITLPRYPEYYYGDELQITCKLKTPREYENFSYKNYLSRFGIYSVCYPEEEDIKLLSRGKGNLILSSFLKLKGEAREVVNKILPEPQASLFVAIILGDKQKIPPEMRDDFSKIGISHIVAISGLQIART